MPSIIDINPSEYRRHQIHGDDRCWIETNCYVDVLVELIHGLGFDPVAALPFTLGIDFEGDQWTFFKYPYKDMLALYGFDIQELNPWNSVVHHVEEQVARGRPVLIELDSFYLPDTAGTAYGVEHVKSTVAVNAIDIEQQHMGYFHGQGYYHVEGSDFAELFLLKGKSTPRILPPYIEYIKLRQSPEALRGEALLKASLTALRYQLVLMPKENPFIAFKVRFEQDLPMLMERDMAFFHQYSFATLRQYGACFELAKTYIEWLQAQGESDLEPVIQAYDAIANSAKALQFQLARAMARKKALETSVLDTMAENWSIAVTLLTRQYIG